MKVRYFLGQRIAFIRQFYVVTSAPYVERKRKIEAEEAPWVPGYSEDGEPWFLEEWLEADESLQVLGRSCISMLVATLHVYFKTWQQLINKPIDESMKVAFKNGWLNGYKEYFACHVRIKFEKAPVSLAVLEELVLARNRIQHPESITTDTSHFSNADLEKMPRPFFIDERDSSLLSEADEGECAWLLPPAIHVSAEKLECALKEVEQFAEWLETVESEPDDGQIAAPPQGTPAATARIL